MNSQPESTSLSLAAATALIVLFSGPALALTVVDGSDAGIPAGDLAKILSIMAPQGGDLSGLRLASGQGGDHRYYCGKMRGPNGFVSFMANVIADQKYVSGSSDRDADAKLLAFGCL
jgi:hypothetical protein